MNPNLLNFNYRPSTNNTPGIPVLPLIRSTVSSLSPSIRSNHSNCQQTSHSPINSAMINEMQTSQSYLPFDEHANLFTYFINESDNCASMTPNQMTSGDLLPDQSHGNSHLNQSQQQHMGTTNDHPYSRVERDSRADPSLTPISNTVNYVGNSPNLLLTHRLTNNPIAETHHHPHHHQPHQSHSSHQPHQHVMSHHLQQPPPPPQASQQQTQPQQQLHHPNIHSYVQSNVQQAATNHHPIYNSTYTPTPTMVDHGSPEQCRGLLDNSPSHSPGNLSRRIISENSPLTASPQGSSSASLLSGTTTYTSSSQSTSSQKSDNLSQKSKSSQILGSSNNSELENCSPPDKNVSNKTTVQISCHPAPQQPLIDSDSSPQLLEEKKSETTLATNLDKTFTAEVRMVVTTKIVQQLFYRDEVLAETLVSETPVVNSIGTVELNVSDLNKNESILISSPGKINSTLLSSFKLNPITGHKGGSVNITTTSNKDSKKSLKPRIPPSLPSEFFSNESRNFLSSPKSTSGSSKKSSKLVKETTSTSTTSGINSKSLSSNDPNFPINSPASEPASQSGSLKRKANFTAIGNKKSKKTLSSVDEKEVGKEQEKMIDSEETRRETASALLSLQGDSLLVKEELTQEIVIKNKREPEFRPIEKDNRVFAKWARDKNFYPGKVTSPQTDSKWLITFDDGEQRSVHESEIISVPYLCPGQSVMLTYSDDFCAQRVIKRCYIRNDDVAYEIESDDTSNKRYPTRNIFLTLDMATVLLSKQSKSPLNASKYADVDLNNIIPKRSRVMKIATPTHNLSGDDHGSVCDSDTGSVSSNKSTKSKNSLTKQLGPSLSPSTPLSDITTSTMTTTTSTTSATVTSVSSSKSKKSSSKHPPPLPIITKRSNVGGSCVSSESGNSNNDPASNSSRSKSSSFFNSKLHQGEREKLMGPVPPEGSTLFQDIGFLLTTPDRINKSNGEMLSSEAGRSIPFDCDYIIHQIKTGSGRVFDTLDAAKSSTEIKEIVLIAYTYLKSSLYMQCLHAGIQCVMHTWVIECCREGQLLPKTKFLLPSGYSIIKSNLPSDKNVFKKSANLFKGLRIMIADPKLVDTWKSVLTTGQATIVTSLPASVGSSTRKAANSVDMIVADNNCPATVIKKAQQMNIPIVTSEYLAQCLINGKKLPHDAHDEFKYK